MSLNHSIRLTLRINTNPSPNHHLMQALTEESQCLARVSAARTPLRSPHGRVHGAPCQALTLQRRADE